jgi:uncharacterized protein (TIGR01244 family)
VKDPVKLRDNLAVGGQPTIEDLGRLARAGYGTIVNLRRVGETLGPSEPDPQAERQAAQSLGLDYVHIPISTDDLRFEDLDALRWTIDGGKNANGISGSAVYVHCGAGQRACALSLAATATNTSADPVAEAARHGFVIVDDKLAAFVRRAVAEDGKAVSRGVSE